MMCQADLLARTVQLPAAERMKHSIFNQPGVSLVFSLQCKLAFLYCDGLRYDLVMAQVRSAGDLITW